MKYMLLIHQGTALETQAALPEAEQKQVWADYADLPTLVNLLLERGFSPEETSKLIGGNYVRIFTKAYENKKAG